MASVDPARLIQNRMDVLKHYENRAKHLDNMERNLHRSLPRHTEQVVKDKRILLFKEMLRDIGYDDQPVADLLVNGVQVVGCLERFSIWPPADNGTTCTVAEVEEFSKIAQN